MAKGQGLWKAGTEAAEPGATESPGLPTSPSSLPTLHSQSLARLQEPHTIGNLFFPASPSLFLLSDQFAIMSRSFPA